MPMPPAKSANPAPRRRTRKRKRRAVSLSSSSSSSESSSEDESSPRIVRTVPETPKPMEESSESDSSDSSSSSGSSMVSPSKEKITPTPSQKHDKLRRSPSPSPPPAEIPSFLPPRGDPTAEEKEKELKEKFRKFWMVSVADGFRDDLEELRKVRAQAQITMISLFNGSQEPNLGAGRLALLIDSLASGAEVFSSKTDENVSEMDVIMG